MADDSASPIHRVEIVERQRLVDDFFQLDAIRYRVPRSDGTTPQAKRVAIAANDPKLVEGFIPEIDVEPALPGERRVKQATGLPDFTGLTIAQAFEAAETAKVELVATGSGIAVGQDLPPGAVDSGTRVHVHFESPY